MLAIVGRRLVQSVGVLWAIATIVFVLVRIIGSPARLMLPPEATAEQIQALSRSLGLLEPLYRQYFDYLRQLLQGDLGTSVWTQSDIASLIMSYLPATLSLALVTMCIALVLGISLGTVAAAQPGSMADRAVSGLSFIAISLPEFWFGLLLIAVVSVNLRLLPTSGYGGWQYFILPVMTLLARPLGRIAQTTKVALREELSKEHVTTALANGLSRRRVLLTHGLRNSLASVITLAGDETANLVAGAVVVETVFGWPGVGRLSIQAIEHRDPDLVVAIVLVVAALVLLINLIIDLAYSVLDPRVKSR